MKYVEMDNGCVFTLSYYFIKLDGWTSRYIRNNMRYRIDRRTQQKYMLKT